ncbi:MAG: hypothetical protein Q7S66_04005 [bacterium]|nr:hypothetical protein [bacterium]
MPKKILARALGHAVLAVTYITSVTLFMSNAEKTINPEKNFLGPVVFLTLLVLSVAVMGILIFGKPILMYLDNNKKEAVYMLLATVGWLAVALVLGVSALLIF